MAEDRSVHSFADDDCSSESDTQRRRTSRFDVGYDHEGETSPAGLVLLASPMEDHAPDAHMIRSFDRYDQGSERFDDEIDAPMSREEEQLIREIEHDQRVDEELGRKLTRAALLNSPLLMAATSEVVKSGGTQGFYSPMETATPSLSRGTYSTLESRDNYGSDSSDLDQDTNEDDLVFAGRQDISDKDQSGPLDFDESMDHTMAGGSSRAVRFRRHLCIIGWTVAVLLVISLVVVLGIRQTTRSRELPGTVEPFGAPSSSINPSLTPSVSPRPTITAQPTVSSSMVPSETPSRPLRTTSPSMEPETPSSEPTYQTLIPTNPPFEPSPLPTSFNVSAPTSQPSQAILAPSLVPTTLPSSQSPDKSSSTSPSSPITLEPILFPTPLPSVQQTTPSSQPPQSPTTSPNKAPTTSPSSSPDDANRRADITSLFVSISGAIALMDARSPQYQAMQWIIDDDPLMLLANNTPAIIQRYALSTLYYATSGDTAWLSCGPPSGSSPCSTQLRRFLSGAPECMWLGVSCDFNKEITGINIRGNGLNGQLPAEVGELSLVSSLSFGGNSLYGTIPTNLEYLTLLRFLILNDNKYSSTIPTHLGSLAALSYLHLGNNLFSGTIPSEIFVPSLEHFDAGYNRLSGTIPITAFTISDNLQHIDISNNKISGALPSGLGDLVALNTFSAVNNSFTGTLPGSIISDTLATLNIGNNRLRGTLPPEIYMFGSSLTFLNLGVNSFQGTISPRYGEMVRLQTLVFFFNGLTGTIPTELGQLTSLGVLHLAGTNLQGTMPDEVCSLTERNLRTLTSDCMGSDAAVQCSCCTFCY